MSSILSREPGCDMRFGFLPFDQNRGIRGSASCLLFTAKCQLDFHTDPRFLQDLEDNHLSEELWKPRVESATREWDRQVESMGEKAGGWSVTSVLQYLQEQYPTQSFELQEFTDVDKMHLAEILVTQSQPFTVAFTACSAMEPKASNPGRGGIDVSGCHTFPFLVHARTYVVDSHHHSAGGLFALSMPTDLTALVNWLYDRGLDLLGCSKERTVDLVICRGAKIIDCEEIGLTLMKEVAPFYSWQRATLNDNRDPVVATYCLSLGDFLPASCDYGNSLLKEFLSVGLKLRSLQLHLKENEPTEGASLEAILAWFLSTFCIGPRDEADKDQHGDVAYCTGPTAFAKQLEVITSKSPHAGATPLSITDYRGIYYVTLDPLRCLRQLKACFEDVAGNSDGVLGAFQSVEEGFRVWQALVPKLINILHETDAYKAKQLSRKLMKPRFQRFAKPNEWSKVCIRDLEAVTPDQKRGFSCFPDKAVRLSAVAGTFRMNPLDFSLAYCQWSDLPIDATWVCSNAMLLRSTASHFHEQHGFALRPANLVQKVLSQLEPQPAQPVEKPAKKRKTPEADCKEGALSKTPDLEARPVGAHALQWSGPPSVFSGQNVTCVLCKRVAASGTNVNKTFGEVSPGTCFAVLKGLPCLGQPENAEHYRRRSRSLQGSKTWLKFFASCECGSAFCGPNGTIQTEFVKS